MNPQDSTILIQMKSAILERQFEKASDLLQSFLESSELSQEEDLLGILYETQIQNFQKDFEEAQISAEMAYQISKSLNLIQYTIDALINLIISEMAFEDMAKIEDQIIECENLLHEFPEELFEEKQERIAALSKVEGQFDSIMGDIENAVNYYTIAFEIYESFGYQYEVVELYNNLGESYRLLGNLDAALNLFEKGFQKAKDINYQAIIPYFTNHLGQIYRVQGNLTQALMYYEQGLQFAEVLGHEKYFIVDFSAIGSIYWQQGNADKALQFLNENFKNCEIFGGYGNAPLILFVIIQIKIEKQMYNQLESDLGRLKQLAESSNTEAVKLRYKLAQALVLKTSLRARKRIQAEDILKQILEGKTVEHELTVLALLNLCDLLLIELKITNDLEFLKEIEPYLKQLTKIAEKQHSYWLLSEVFISQSKLSLVRLEFNEARRYLTQAQHLADEHGFTQMAQRISNDHDALLTQMSAWEKLNKEYLDVSERLQMAKLDEQMSKILNQTPEDTEQEGDNNLESNNEEPMSITMMRSDGGLIFYYSFTSDWAVDETLFGGFLSAFNSFSDELFAQSLDRANFGQYTILMKIVATLKMVYVFKGPSYRAQQKFSTFLDLLYQNSDMWSKIIAFSDRSQLLDLSNIPEMESLIRSTILE